MVAALNVFALALGVAGGGLMATICSLLFGGVLSVAGVGNGAEIGLLIGIALGLTFGGLVAGRVAVHSSRFHGSVVGLLLAAVVVLLASLNSASIEVQAVLTMALIAIVLGGLGGWLGGRNRRDQLN